MSLSIRSGQTAHLSATADDPSGAVDANAVDTWRETDASGAAATSGFVTLTPNGTNCDVAWVAAGSAFVEAVATDPDGNEVTSAPFGIVCLSATDTATVTVSGTVS